jgi:peptidoglycan/LPS O-acetylase OafA/YrhL
VPDAANEWQDQASGRSAQSAQMRRGRKTGLDALRGVAVLFVCATHLGWPGAEGGGWVGVTLFFVLSGYLITRLLVDEQAKHGGINLLAFWGRRGRRLLPALALTLAGTALLFWGLPHLQTKLAEGASYVSNWIRAGGETTWPLGHLWSLAVEEQFYLAWPLAIVLLGARRRPLVALLAALLAWRLFLGLTGASADRIYFGTDSRAPAFLIGALLGLYRPSIPRRWLFPALGLLVLADPLTSVAGLGAIVVLLTPIEALCAVAVGASVEWRGPSALAGLGRISYGFYLFQYPLISWLWPRLDRPWLRIVAFTACLALAGLSFACVERPLSAWLSSRPWRLPRRSLPGRSLSDRLLVERHQLAREVLDQRTLGDR